MATYVRPFELPSAWSDRVVSRKVVWAGRFILWPIVILFAFSAALESETGLFGVLFAGLLAASLLLMVTFRELSVSASDHEDMDDLIECINCGSKTPASGEPCEHCGESYATKASRAQSGADSTSS